MECKNFSEVHICNSSDWTRLTRFIRKGGKLTRAVYAGLIVCFVPSVLCQGWSRHLTFDEIYNDTNYVQLQQRPRVYELPEYNYNLGNSHVYNSGEDDRFISHKYNLEDGRRPETHVYNLENVRNQVTSGYDNEDDRRLAPHLYNLENNRRNPNIHIFYPDHERRKPIPQKNSLEGGRKLPANDYSIEEDIRENEVDVDVTGTDIARVSLLVGFSHDPFRYSVPQEDYLKGVRNVSPMTLMRGDRSKRGVLHLYNMMSCATGCEPLSYKGYGCYCGFLGSGRPTDGIDSCCKMHDQCYENLYCPFFTVYFQPYYWKCYKGRPLCALENAHSQHQFINGCAARLCECDRQFAMCVRRFPCPRRRALCHSSPIRLLQNLLMFR